MVDDEIVAVALARPGRTRSRLLARQQGFYVGTPVEACAVGSRQLVRYGDGPGDGPAGDGLGGYAEDQTGFGSGEQIRHGGNVRSRPLSVKD